MAVVHNSVLCQGSWLCQVISATVPHANEKKATLDFGGEEYE